jgi:asparagine synthase (glutamine-hydrolysing)
MSGICAAWQKNNAGRLVRNLKSISSRLSLVSTERINQATDQAAGVAVSARFPTQQIYQDSNVLIACDAELYNITELLDAAGGELQATGGARTASLIAALYARFGRGFPNKLRGAFSVIIWDRMERRLFAAIDGFGIKRLAYFQNDNLTLVSSRVDALAQCDDIDLNVNAKAIANVLNFSANLGPGTIFTNIHRLMPGEMLSVRERHTSIDQYWDMRYDASSSRSPAQLAQELKSVLAHSVQQHCADQPASSLGSFLSGGTDSSTVVGLMTQAMGAPVKSFSIGFQEEHFNELGYADLAAARFGSEHYKYLVGPDDCFSAIPQIVRCFDEPFGNASAIPTYFCARLAAETGVQALLAGDGGDELFGGNERYALDNMFQMYHRVPAILRERFIEPVVGVFPTNTPLVKKARGYIRRANMGGVERMLSFQFLRTHPLADVFEHDFLRTLGDYTILDTPSRHYSHATAREHLDRLLYVDMKITLADNDLPKVTYMSELAGIQPRFPFLDRSVAEFAGRVPAWLKVKGLEKRYLFKQAFRDLLPREILKKKKHGFGIPVAQWMKSDRRMRELCHDTLFSARATGRGYFRPQFIEDIVRKHESDESSYYGDAIWTILALELWHRQVVDEAVRVTA